MKEKAINIIKFIITIIMFFFFSRMLGMFFRWIGIQPTMFDAKDYGYVDTLLELIYAVVIYLLYSKNMNKDFADTKNSFKTFINRVLKYFAVFFVLKIGSAIVTSIVGFAIGAEIGESENQNMIIKITESAPLMMIISSVILAPIVEEGIFRLGLRKVISNDYLFIVLSGLIFGLMHIFPTDLSLSVALTYGITYVTMGIYLAYIYVDTDNIWINIIIHALNNLISMLAIITMT